MRVLVISMQQADDAGTDVASQAHSFPIGMCTSPVSGGSREIWKSKAVHFCVPTRKSPLKRGQLDTHQIHTPTLTNWRVSCSIVREAQSFPGFPPRHRGGKSSLREAVQRYYPS